MLKKPETMFEGETLATTALADGTMLENIADEIPPFGTPLVAAPIGEEPAFVRSELTVSGNPVLDPGRMLCTVEASVATTVCTPGILPEVWPRTSDVNADSIGTTPALTDV